MNGTITKTTRYFKEGKECLPEEADEVVTNEFDEKRGMIDEKIFYKSPKQPKPTKNTKEQL